MVSDLNEFFASHVWTLCGNARIEFVRIGGFAVLEWVLNMVVDLLP